MKGTTNSTRIWVQNANQKGSLKLISEWALIFCVGGIISGGLGGGIVHTIPGTHGAGGISGALIGAIEGGIAGVLLGAFGKLVILLINALRRRQNTEYITKSNCDKSEMPAKRPSGWLALLARRFWESLENGRWLPMLLFVMTCICMWFIRGIHHGGDTGRYLGGGIGLPESRAASSQAALAISTSLSASSGVSPNAEQALRSGMSAI